MSNGLTYKIHNKTRKIEKRLLPGSGEEDCGRFILVSIPRFLGIMNSVKHVLSLALISRCKINSALTRKNNQYCGEPQTAQILNHVWRAICHFIHYAEPTSAAFRPLLAIHHRYMYIYINIYI